ncbi:glycoside hydrolase family 97 catalytic domain-containing protein [Chitinophaga sp. Hz27]|uniref:glycoside hydrolase family 97 protein n=1 Tax=Chitinophaga sp. Hz27 TaxID=3347169 RepID=UPI0035E2FA4C
MKLAILSVVLIAMYNMSFAQKITIRSPNQRISVSLFSTQDDDVGGWYIKAVYNSQGKTTEAIPRIDLGLSRSDQDFSKEMKFLHAGRPRSIKEQYTALHGKKSICTNAANEIVISFENPSKASLNLVLRAYDDGIAFRYEFPEPQGTFVVKDELTTYSIPKETTRWMEKWNTANEGLYTAMKDSGVQKAQWCYPALFSTKDTTCWFLLHEADVTGSYCGTKLSNENNESNYKLTFPDQWDGRGLGASQPTITLPWQSPWRVIIAGSLSDIVASTLVDDISTPAALTDISWIKPGIASWNYWSSNHGTKDYKIVCAFADLAAEMNWPYTLLDWEWDEMSNGGKLEDALQYIHSKGVKPLMWYNSGGPHTYVSSTPRDRLLTHESRVEEFTKLKKLGVAGVKVDFFESEKQSMIQYYLDILKDAAACNMMVYFHGCLVPRGWTRTYPNLMTYEAVRGAEWYNNGPDFTMAAPNHNTVLPFTRNVVGPMDYTPVTFTNSQYPHITSYGHELALSIVFESGLQHMADRPEGYQELPDAAKALLKEVPAAWDDTKLLKGYPGKEVILARRKDHVWFIGGINAEMKEKKEQLNFSFLPDGGRFKLTLISDGNHDKALITKYLVVDKNSAVDVAMLRRGGFAAILQPME